MPHTSVRLEAPPPGATGTESVLQVSVTADSVVEVWAGSSVALEIRADGVVLTDDGDLLADGTSHDPFTAPSDLWRTQDPTLRHGRWVVYHPPQQRTLTFPDRLLPAAGQSRTLTLSVRAHGQSEPVWSVDVSHASAPEPAATTTP